MESSKMTRKYQSLEPHIHDYEQLHFHLHMCGIVQQDVKLQTYNRLRTSVRDELELSTNDHWSSCPQRP